MTTLLAQTDTPARTTGGLLRLVEYARDLQMPTRNDYLAGLEDLGHHQLQAVLLVLVGAVFLIFGFRFFKVLVVSNAAVIGGLVGAYLGLATSESQNMPLLLGLAGAVLLGAIAWPLLKYSVCAMGAAAGGVIGTAVWYFIAQTMNRQAPLQFAWAGALIGMVTVGMLTFIVFRMSVMVFTALQGSVMIVSGALALLMLHAGMRDSIRPELIANRYLVYILVGVPAVVGFSFQFATESGKIKKKRAASEKPPL